MVISGIEPPELQLVLSCARLATNADDDRAIRSLLHDGVDWTRFAQKLVDHGLGALAGRTLERVAPELVPADILEALQAILVQTRAKNLVLFEELLRVLDTLARKGVRVVPIKGPVLALQAYGDLGLRAFRDLDFLIPDEDLAETISAMAGLGYERKGQLSAAQFDLVHRLQGQEVMFKRAAGTAAEPHTRLTSMGMALDIDYVGLWSRVLPVDFNGHEILVLSPEDDFIALAVHGGKEMWWNIKWTCDVAAFICSHPQLNWDLVMERSASQGCSRMTMLAIALARRFLGAAIPDSIIARERADPTIEIMTGKILGLWRSDGQAGPPSNKWVSMDRLRLHDGLSRRASYVTRTLFLPTPQHVGMVRLPAVLGFAYVPLKLAHDLVAFPPWLVYQFTRRRAERFRKALATSRLGTAAFPKFRESAEKAKVGRIAETRARNAAVREPDKASNWRNLATEMMAAGRQQDALTLIDKALALDPRDSRAWAIRGRALSESMRYDEAVVACDCALALDPDNTAADRVGIHSSLFACDWRRRDVLETRVADSLKSGRRIITPFDHRAISDSEPESRQLTRIWSQQFPPSPSPLWAGERYRHDKIRIAYVSSDFRDHVCAVAIAGCFEQHDRSRFEIFGISHGPNDASDMRHRLERAFDRFLDVSSLGDRTIASTMRELEIDIAIDLNGYAGDRKTQIFTHRAAPLQVNFLGYPGTMGLPFYDYIIADPIVIPPENRVHFSEKVAYLPVTFLPADGTRKIAPVTTSRAEAGLPQSGFVFTCHNTSYKIAPEVFDVWMDLLRYVEDSVLWLASPNSSARVHLRREAQNRGVDPERLVFATRVPTREDHLARLRLADLFLDTLPYNAHSTAVDALWAGLPLLTCVGGSFAARVAASLLHAIELPELVAESLSEYREIAYRLAKDADALSAVREKLARNRMRTALFDTARYTRRLESAYVTMWERQQAELAPEHFSAAGEKELVA